MDAARLMGTSLDTLNYLGSGGAKRPASQVAELQKAFPNANLATGWGMTETNACGIGLIGDEYLDNPDAAGRLYPPIQELAIWDDDGQEVPTGAIGELTIKSACNMRCYLNKPEATDEVLQNGWLRTGDLGKIDEDDIVTILDRKKNIVIRGGENIACLDVEGALHRHPAISESCAFSVPDDRLGEVQCRRANPQRHAGDTRGHKSFSCTRDFALQNSRIHMDTNRPIAERTNR
jgi:acyl-CoA synthetase (AMP-forming)/AMP-acid ligase II